MTTCGEFLVQSLEQYGIDTVFGIPGVHTIELYRGLPGSAIRHITPRHEQGAGFMADGYARVSGKPAACFVVTGPGITNTLTAMGQAYADSIPMLVVSTVNRRSEMGMQEGRLHELPDQQAMVAGVSAFSHTVMSPDKLPHVLAHAFAVFRSERPRPVHIQLPLDVITMSADHVQISCPELPRRPAPAPECVERAAHYLQGAKRPLLLIGGGSVDAHAEVRRLVDDFGIPVANTINAKGIMPPRHPLCIGSYMSFDFARQYLAEADVVLAVGTELGETDYDVLFNDDFRIPGRLLRVDIDFGQFSRNQHCDVALYGDSALALQVLLAEIEANGLNIEPDWHQRTQELRSRIAHENSKDEALACHQSLFSVIDDVIKQPIIVGDSTQPVYTSNLFYEPLAPRCFFNSSTGYGTLGYAPPAAIGAAIAANDRSVVAVVGDGGLQFSIAELATAVELGVPVIFLLWNNQGYGEIKKCMLNHDIEPIGVDIHTPDFARLAEGFGLRHYRADSLQQFSDALQNAVSSAKPAVIEIHEVNFQETR